MVRESKGELIEQVSPVPVQLDSGKSAGLHEPGSLDRHLYFALHLIMGQGRTRHFGETEDLVLGTGKEPRIVAPAAGRELLDKLHVKSAGLVDCIHGGGHELRFVQHRMLRGGTWVNLVVWEQHTDYHCSESTACALGYVLDALLAELPERTFGLCICRTHCRNKHAVFKGRLADCNRTCQMFVLEIHFGFLLCFLGLAPAEC